MTTDTTAPSYWLNWRFFLCAIWILISMTVAAIVIWRYEGSSKSNAEQKVGDLYEDEAWRTSSKRIHPVWLLAYRVFGFSILLAALIEDIVLHTARIFYFYTEWTFILVTVYFALASIFSLDGCLNKCKDVRAADCVELDAERGSYVAPTPEENGNTPSIPSQSNTHEKLLNRKRAGIRGYIFQIMFQTTAGAVVLTDVVFWLILYPFLTSKDYKLNFMKVCMHSLNAIILLGEVALNNMRFPFFRVAYFILWTSTFVIFQWIVHACVSLW
ncbi:OLC1v1028328C4 [Oldenlandia corymbosa var. corymbosa]|nr:OLC1v1028328C4 [Oldenlandia corymbosa var. corymbosa]